MGPQVYMIDFNPDMKQEYKAVSFDQSFPLKIVKKEKVVDYDDKKNDPNSINLKLPELVLMVHGSLESKQKIIDDFNEMYPECSKNSIERKLKECFNKDKKQEEPRQRYFASEELLVNLTEEFPGGCENEKLVELAKSRL